MWLWIAAALVASQSVTAWRDRCMGQMDRREKQIEAAAGIAASVVAWHEPSDPRPLIEIVFGIDDDEPSYHLTFTRDDRPATSEWRPTHVAKCDRGVACAQTLDAFKRSGHIRAEVTVRHRRGSAAAVQQLEAAAEECLADPAVRR